MIEEAGGVVFNFAKFLKQCEEVTEDEPEINNDNRITHLALLFPMSKILKSTEIIRLCDGKILNF